jgi:GTP1/Obg family GTP-binding protein
MVEANKSCNKAMKEFVTSLLTAGRVPAKKWLRQALGRINDLIKASDDFEGFGCKASVKIKWKSPIIMTTY